jgi:TonB-linked SusC/RagA family outer membrane protein
MKLNFPIRWLFTGAMVLFFVVVHAQTISVSGRVLDETGEGLPGATIQEVGTGNGVITDIDGNFSLKVAAGSQISISFIGYVTQIVNASENLNISLTPDVTALDEIVVIGYGEQQKKVATGAIAAIGNEKFEGFNVASVENALSGQLSGVQVSSSSGAPGANKPIFIRGVGTNGNASPLYVVDGLFVDDINWINPSDVLSINVLKDAASTSIYGLKGANGVVIVTTKKGKEGVFEVSYDGFTSSSKPWRLPEMLNSSQYIELINEKYANSNQALPIGFPATDAGITGSTNWFDEIIQPSKIQSHKLSFSKGTEAGNIYVSLSYWDEQGAISPDKSNYKRITGRINSLTKLSDRLTLGQNLAFFNSRRESIPENNAFGSPLADAYNLDPLTPVFDETKEFGFGQSTWVQKEYINPLSRIFITNNEYKQSQLLGNLYLDFKVIEGLTVRTDLGYEYRTNLDRGFTPAYDFRNTFQNLYNGVFQGSFERLQLKSETYATYKKTILTNHNFEAVLGTTQIKATGTYLGGGANNVLEDYEFNPNWWYLDGSPDAADSTHTNYGGALAEIRNNSFFGRVIYNYDQKYLFTVSIRRDGSSQIGPNNRYGIFPSVSAGWVISDEAFFNFAPVDYLKLRASWGRNGNDRIGAFAYESVITGGSNYAFGNNFYTGFSEARPANPDLRWEQVDMVDLGFEAGFLDGDLNVEFSYYNKTTVDLLIGQATASVVGANGDPITNVGSVRNKGIELDLRYAKILGDLRINTAFNFTTLDNEVIKVNSDNAQLPGVGWPVRNVTITAMEAGLPIGYFIGYKTAGVFNDQADIFSYINDEGDPVMPNAKPGDLKFVDVNKDGEITTADMTYIGKPWADVRIGLDISLAYKGFDMRALFAGSFGNDVYRIYERQDVPLANMQTEWLDRWTPDNINAEYPRLSLGGENQVPSDFYVENASFVRLRNLQIGYSLFQKGLDAIQAKKLRVYVSLDNILTFTKYTGFDPEIGTYGNVFDTGLDKGFYPSAQSIGGGLTLTF